jgi:hypothetical protein
MVDETIEHAATLEPLEPLDLCSLDARRCVTAMVRDVSDHLPTDA